MMLENIRYFYIHRPLRDLFLWFIWKIPSKICLWCFIRVHSCGEAHWSYDECYKVFVEKHGIKE